MQDKDRTSEVLQEVTRRIKTLGEKGKVREAIAELAGLSKLGIQPDTQAATALVGACARRGDMEVAQNVFEELFGERPHSVHTHFEAHVQNAHLSIQIHIKYTHTLKPILSMHTN
jgi:hypothetical protein